MRLNLQSIFPGTHRGRSGVEALVVADEELLLYTVCQSGQSPLVILIMFRAIVSCTSLLKAYPLLQVYSKNVQIQLMLLAGVLRASILAATERGRVAANSCYSQVPQAAVWKPGTCVFTHGHYWSCVLEPTTCNWEQNFVWMCRVKSLTGRAWGQNQSRQNSIIKILEMVELLITP